MFASSARPAAAAAAFLLLFGASAAVPQALAAQQTPAGQQLPAGVTEREVAERLRESGLTHAQARARLQQMGRDPALADRYYDAIARDSVLPERAVTTDVVAAMQGIGVVLRPGPTVSGDTMVALSEAPLPRLEMDGLPVFGRELFRLATSQFQPVGTGPVDPGYRLGPGDQLVAVLTGDVELAHTLEVNREGLVVIPDVGQIHVAGLTLRELEDRLYERLGRVYSGVGRGAGASTQFSLSLGALRSNQIFLVGEVERPGAYQVSSVATVFNALYQARGPNDNGSFRRIEVRRGGRTIRVVDVYDYLLRGDSRDDIRLEQGDIIFVPVVGRQVAVQGAIRRPAWFELREGENLRDLLAFAGGLQAGASVARLQIDRIVAPEQRRPGVDRVLVDVDMRDALGGRVALQDDDRVSVFRVAGERRNRLIITGGVRRPGLLEWREGMTLWDAVERAEGLQEFAYTARAHVYRLNPEDGSRNLLRTPLFRDAGGAQQHLVLADRDSIVVFSRSELRNPEQVRIAGFVKEPGVYALAPGMTVRDLVLAAGGFAPGADETEAELARRTDIYSRTDRTAEIVRVPLARPAAPARMAADATGAAPAGAARGVPEWAPGGGEIELQDDDVVYIRRAVGYEAPRLVRVTGEVETPGTYVLQSRQERLLDLVQRAGGLTGEAHPAGLRLVRENRLVATDLARAHKNPRSPYNLLLEAGDSLHIPEYDPTVLVMGAVIFETRTLHQRGMELSDYISRAGGYAPNANRGRVSVTHPDGERYTVRGGLFGRGAPPVPPGSTIFVPERPDAPATDWGDILTKSLSIMATTLTMWLAIERLRRQ